MKSKFHKDIYVANVNLEDVTSFSWNMLSLCLMRMKHNCMSPKYKLQVICVQNGKMCLKWTACRFGNWILPYSMRQQTCKGNCQMWGLLKLHSSGGSHHGALYTKSNGEDWKHGRKLWFFKCSFYICITISSGLSWEHFLLSHWKWYVYRAILSRALRGTVSWAINIFTVLLDKAFVLM